MSLVNYIKLYLVLWNRFWIVWLVDCVGLFCLVVRADLNLTLKLNIVNSLVMVVIARSLATKTVRDMGGLGGGSRELTSVKVVGNGHSQQRSKDNVDKVVSVVLGSTQSNVDGQKQGEEGKQQLGGLASVRLVRVNLSVDPQAEEGHSHKSSGRVPRRSGLHSLQNGVHVSSTDLDGHVLVNGSSLGRLTSGNEIGSVSAHVDLEEVGDEAVEEGSHQKGGQGDGHELDSVLGSRSQDGRETDEHKEGNDNGVENTRL